MARGSSCGHRKRVVPAAKAGEGAVRHKGLTVRSADHAGKQCVNIFSNSGPERRWKPRARV